MLVRELMIGGVAGIGGGLGGALGGGSGFLLGSVLDGAVGGGSLIGLISLAGLLVGGLIGMLLGVYASLRSWNDPVPGMTTGLFVLILCITTPLALAFVIDRHLAPLWLVVVWSYPSAGWVLGAVCVLAWSVARIWALRWHLWHAHQEGVVRAVHSVEPGAPPDRV
jgi:hypothetical protein